MMFGLVALNAKLGIERSSVTNVDNYYSSFYTSMDKVLSARSDDSASTSSAAVNGATDAGQLAGGISEGASVPARIAETTFRPTNPQQAANDLGTTARVNEGLVHGFMPLVSYTSASDTTQIRLLNRLGYTSWGDRLNVENSSIAPSEALLGARYLLSQQWYPGYNQTPVATSDQVNLWRMDRTLPLVYTVPGYHSEVPYPANPFEYLNNIYKNLTNSNEDILNELPASSVEEAGVTVFSVENNAAPVYAFFNIDSAERTKVAYDGNAVRLGPNFWLGTDTFYVERSAEQQTSKVEIQHPAPATYNQARFYALNTEAFERAVEKINAGNTAQIVQWKDREVEISVHADQESTVQTSIPVQSGWTVTVDGARVEPGHVIEGLYALDIPAGSHTVRFTFEAPGLKLGAAVSAVSLAAVVAIAVIGAVVRRRRGTVTAAVAPAAAAHVDGAE